MSRSGALEKPTAAGKSRIFTPARIVALGLCAVLVFGLFFLRFAFEGQSVSVPAGAKAGDLVLRPCDYKAENGSYVADCGTLVVPENRADPTSRLIALPVTRIRARSDHPGEVDQHLFRHRKVDISLYQPQTVGFNAASNFGTMAKVFLGLAVALAALTVLSLLWMAWWVHKRGSFGPIASALLRSLSPVVLGLGGFLLGTLIVLVTMPSVPIDGQLPVILFTGLPIGLGIYLAWVHRDWSTKTKITGVAAAIGGGLIGAWLGFNATSGLLAIATAIVGAAAGANLILLALDIAWDRSNRSRCVVGGVPSAPIPVSGEYAQQAAQPEAVHRSSTHIQHAS